MRAAANIEAPRNDIGYCLIYEATRKNCGPTIGRQRRHLEIAQPGQPCRKTSPACRANATGVAGPEQLKTKPSMFMLWSVWNSCANDANPSFSAPTARINLHGACTHDQPSPNRRGRRRPISSFRTQPIRDSVRLEHYQRDLRVCALEGVKMAQPAASSLRRVETHATEGGREGGMSAARSRAILRRENQKHDSRSTFSGFHDQ